MERVMKKILCTTLNIEVDVTYYLEKINNSDGTFKKKTVQFFNCEAQTKSKELCNLMDCACFKQMRHIEMESNMSNT
jgi:hypothetical protein